MDNLSAQANGGPYHRSRRRVSPLICPPVAPHVQTKRSSPIVETALLLAEMVRHRLRCLAFCSSRKLCELVLNYTREILKETAPELVGTVMAYRAGYSAKASKHAHHPLASSRPSPSSHALAQDRREIERCLFSGELRGVTATNALELGVDVGSLDATLHLGFPGSVASLWQQAGRAGRREKASLCVYVAWGGPLDQYFMKAPHRLFSRPIEHAQVDAQNLQVLGLHVACAAFESPVQAQQDEFYFGSGLGPAIDELRTSGELGRHPTNGSIDDGWQYIGPEKSPAQRFGLRNIEAEKYTLVDERTQQVIEEVEESKAFYVMYEGAVYMQQGRTYLVKTLDLDQKVGTCIQADLKYYTMPVDMKTIRVLGGSLAYVGKVSAEGYPSTTAQCSPCSVTTHWLGFRRIWRGSNEALDVTDLFLPDVTIPTQAAWIRVPHGIRQEVQDKALHFRAGLHAACHAIINILPLYIMCSSADIATECVNPQDTRYSPERLLLFDSQRGGSGICAQARPMFSELMRAALELISACDCVEPAGCPNCTQCMKCNEYNEVLDKQAAVIILQGVMAAEDAYRNGTLKPPDEPSDANNLNGGNRGFLPDDLPCHSVNIRADDFARVKV
eukprot:jgi/Mesen1/9166/ME000591S08489